MSEDVQEKIQNGELAVRHLTPRECWRLMALCPMDRKTGQFDDTNFEKAREVCSDSQLYKQAGNSIVVDCLEHIFESFLYPSEDAGPVQKTLI